VLALLCAIALAPSVRWLERTGAPASLCAAVVVGGGSGRDGDHRLLVRPLGRGPDLARARDHARGRISDPPGHIRIVAVIRGRLGRRVPATPDYGLVINPDKLPGPDTEEATEDTADDDAVDKLVDGGKRLLADWTIGAPRLAAGGLLWAMLNLFLLRDRVMLARHGLSLIPQALTRRAVGRAMRDVRTNVARYLLAITVVNLGLGILVAGALHLIGMTHAPLWGVTAAQANLMPIIGFVILSVVTLAVGIVSFENPVLAFAPFAVLLMLNAIEANMVTPMIVGSRIQIAPIAIFSSIARGAWLWGAAGALIATPALIVAAAFVRRLNANGRPSLPLRQR
jgi:predicted PurR-regulated permease PerM